MEFLLSLAVSDQYETESVWKYQPILRDVIDNEPITGLSLKKVIVSFSPLSASV
jgi:hypothetical protein